MSRFSFVIDGVTYPALDMPLKDSWIKIAKEKGFDLLGRVKDRFHLVTQCHCCETLALIRINVIRDFGALCHACIHNRRAKAAERIGATLLGQDPDDRHYGSYELACGHMVRRQHTRVGAAAAGGYLASCETCREERYAAQAERFGWILVGEAISGRSGYRSYSHRCGHRQDVMVGNMLWNDCTCARCGEGWSAAPSFIYLFRIDLPGLPVVKLGFSKRPAKRLRHQLGIAPNVETEVVRVLPMSSGNIAIGEETACHRRMREAHSDLIVPKQVFGDAINTQSEIYHATAAPVLHALMDRIERRDLGEDGSQPS